MGSRAFGGHARPTTRTPFLYLRQEANVLCVDINYNKNTVIVNE